MPGLRRFAHVCALAGLLALATVVPPASAVIPSVAVYGILEAPIPIPFLTNVPVPPPPTLPDAERLAERPCEQGAFVVDEARRSFSFSESAQQNGCLSVVYNVTVPRGVETFLVSFEANRSVEQTVASTAPRAMVQSLRLRVAGGFVQDQEVFDADLGDRPPEPITKSFEVPQGLRHAQVEWVFEDRSGPSRLEAFSATVWRPTIKFDAIPMPEPVVEVASGLNPDQEYIAHYTMVTAVPSEFAAAAAAGQFSLRMEIDAQLRQVRVDGPDGKPLAESLYTVLTAGGHATLEFPPATLRDVPGPYTVRLDAPDTLQKHGIYQAFSYLALAAPVAAIVAAWIGLRRTRGDTSEGGP